LQNESQYAFASKYPSNIGIKYREEQSDTILNRNKIGFTLYSIRAKKNIYFLESIGFSRLGPNTKKERENNDENK